MFGASTIRLRGRWRPILQPAPALACAKDSIRVNLLMADDPMRDIRLFQVCDLFLAQFNRQSAHGIFQMCNLRCPNDRSSDRLLL
jgi:hypothetical protein